MPNDYIKRSDALMAIQECFDKELEFSYDNAQSCMNRIKAIPTADVEPVRYGWWEYDSDGVPTCSQCGEFALQRLHLYIKNKTFDAPFKLTDYCPNCGAKMNTERVEE